jgi:hypothetical protein
METHNGKPITRYESRVSGKFEVGLLNGRPPHEGQVLIWLLASRTLETTYRDNTDDTDTKFCKLPQKVEHALLLEGQLRNQAIAYISDGGEGEIDLSRGPSDVELDNARIEAYLAKTWGVTDDNPADAVIRLLEAYRNAEAPVIPESTAVPPIDPIAQVADEYADGSVDEDPDEEDSDTEPIDVESLLLDEDPEDGEYVTAAAQVVDGVSVLEGGGEFIGGVYPQGHRGDTQKILESIN